MTSVAFYLYADDKVIYTCRLLRKAVAKDAKLVVTGPSSTLEMLDLILWTFSATDFVPHCDDLAPRNVRQRTPVLLSQSFEFDAHERILINLGTSVPDYFDQFQRVIEVVTDDDDDRHHARQRWRDYLAQGVEPVKFDLDLKALQ